MLLRLLAPIMPFATEEVWSWWQEGSIHHAGLAVGRAEPRPRRTGDPALLDDLAAALAAVRGAKSSAKVSMKTEVTPGRVRRLRPRSTGSRRIEADLRAVGRITGEVTWDESDGLRSSVQVTLAEA